MTKTSTLAACLALALATPATARDLTVEITNLTHGTYFTPLLVAAHAATLDAYEEGEPASAEIQAIAEGGDISGLATLLEGAGATVVTNPAGGLLGPGASATASLDTDRGESRLTIAAMLLPTNDGFVGLDAFPLPRAAGVYTVYLDGYDAGTEVNDERVVDGGGAVGVAGIPADPTGQGGTGGTGATDVELNDKVHIHAGVVGDHDPQGGVSDLAAGVHRWSNPVARVTITVN